MRAVPLPICLNLIHTFEGDAGQPELKARRDPAGNWEIGWSHKLSDPAQYPNGIDRQTADALAVSDLYGAADGVRRVVGDTVVDTELTDAKYAALIDFVYNIGEEKFSTSTLAKLVKGGNHVLAAHEFGRWIYGHGEDGTLVELPGLVRRRNAEKALWSA